MRHFGLALLLLVASRAARAEDVPPSPAAQAAAHVVDAVLSEDGEALGILAARRGLDPYAVVDALLAGMSEAKRSVAPWAARGYASATAQRADAAGLADWVERRIAWSPEQVARDARLRRVREQADRALEKHDVARVLELYQRVEDDVAALPSSLASVALRHDAGTALAFANRLAEAVPLLTDEPAKTGAPVWPVGHVAALAWLVYALAEGPDPASALAPAAEGRDLARAIGHRRAATFSERRARALHLLGRFEESRAEADEGATVALAAGERVPAALSLIGAAAALLQLDRAVEAVDRAVRARAEAEASGLAELIAMTLVLEGAARAAAGQIARGLDLAERGVAAWRGLDVPYQLASALYTVGTACVLAGLKERAEAAFREGVPLAQRAGDARTEGVLRRALGNLLLAAGRWDEAERELLTARALFERVHAASDLQWTLTYLGRLDARRRPGEEGLAALRAAVASAEAGAPRALAIALNYLADEEALRGLLAPAREHARRALALAETAHGGTDWVATSLAILAVADHAEGNVGDSLSRLREATELEAAVSEGLGAEEAAGARAHARASADRGFGIAAKMAHDAETAFAFAEAGRAGVLLRDLLQREQILAARLSPDVAARERETRERVARARARWASAIRAKSSDEVALARARMEVDDALEERERALDRVERGVRAGVDLAAPAVATVDEVRAALPEGSALVLYHLLESRAYAIVVTSSDATLHDLGERGPIERDAEAWLDLVASPDGPEAPLAARLHAALVAPLSKAIGGRTRLVVVPDGVLSFVPFGALLHVDGDAKRRLVEEAEVVHVPSATLFAQLARRLRDAPPGRGVVALGDPAYRARQAGDGSRDPAAGSPSPLPASRAEVEGITGLFPSDARATVLGADATSARLERAVAASPARLRAVHLACHAVVDPAHPRLTGLVLADDEVYSMFDVATHRFEADLVALSACGTARGRLLRGEGVLGLAYGFFLAGASRVLASEWRVEDASARDLLVRVYEGWIRDGLTPAAALRRAQRERIAAGGPRAHPYHWAAFALWGLP